MGRRGALVAGIALTTLVLVVLVTLRGGSGQQPDEAATRHARAACEVTVKAGEAAQVDSPERYAAASFLLDRAVVESGRAAEIDAAFTDLDEAVRAVHTAAHAGRRDPWLVALDTAVKECDRADVS